MHPLTFTFIIVQAILKILMKNYVKNLSIEYCSQSLLLRRAPGHQCDEKINLPGTPITKNAGIFLLGPQVEGWDILMCPNSHGVKLLLLCAHTHKKSFIFCHSGIFGATFPETMQMLQWRGKENILIYKNRYNISVARYWHWWNGIPG